MTYRQINFSQLVIYLCFKKIKGVQMIIHSKLNLKILSPLWFIKFSFLLLIFVSKQLEAKVPHPHLEFELTGKQYFQLLEQNKKNYNLKLDTDSEDQELNKYLEYGKRNLQWIDLINSSREKGNKLSLSSEATTKAYPITSPRSINFAGLQQDWAILQALLPETLKKVIFENAEMTSSAPLSDREMVEWLIQVDNAYQNSARYKMLKPNKNEYAELAAMDLRPYFRLKNNEELNNSLTNWKNLPENTQRKLSTDLQRICLYKYDNTSEICSNELASSITNITLITYKDNYFREGERLYQEFFQIPESRTDTKWIKGDVDKLIIPFTNPQNESVLNFLKYNIEDEFKWLNWKLELNFTEDKSDNITHVVFVPGSTPHVNGIAGSEITMDANSLLTEYDVQWTIRHEYGHVLGFPDCYLEFYDTDSESFVSYQLDITNLMCSRRGHFKQIHFDELKRVYQN